MSHEPFLGQGPQNEAAVLYQKNESVSKHIAIGLQAYSDEHNHYAFPESLEK